MPAPRARCRAPDQIVPGPFVPRNPDALGQGLGQVPHEWHVRGADSPLLTGLSRFSRQAFQPELAHRFHHLIPWLLIARLPALPAPGSSRRARRNSIEDGDGRVGRGALEDPDALLPTYGFGGVEREPADETESRRKSGLLRYRRAGRSSRRWRRAWVRCRSGRSRAPPVRSGERMLQPGQQRRWRQRRDAGGRQLQRQR